MYPIEGVILNTCPVRTRFLDCLKNPETMKRYTPACHASVARESTLTSLPTVHNFKLCTAQSGHRSRSSNSSLDLPRRTRIAVAPGSSSTLPEYQDPFNKPVKQNTLGCKPHSGGFDGQLMEQSPTYRALFVALDITLGLMNTISGSRDLTS